MRIECAEIRKVRRTVPEHGVSIARVFAIVTIIVVIFITVVIPPSPRLFCI